VLVRNPRHAEDPACYDPDGPEWAWRDVACDVGSVPEVVTALERAVREPRREAASRARYRERIPGIEIVDFEGSGHDLWRPDPHAFGRTLREFFARVDAAPTRGANQ
jgi:hypothetical protein